MSKCLITGASGGLGQALYAHFAPRYATSGLCYHNHTADFLRLDLTQPGALTELVQDLRPELIINTVAWTDVDACDQQLAKALALNVHTALHVRQAAEQVGARVVHISTNDVFDGLQGLYSEADTPRPVNFYSWSKYMAEQMFYGYAPSLILRVHFLAWYASGKQSFAHWLCQQLRRQQTVTLVQDQFNSPVYAGTVAHWLESMLELTGVWHLGSGRYSRYACGVRLAEKMGLNTDLIKPGYLHDLRFKAPRPYDVSLDCQKVRQACGLETHLDAELDALVAAAEIAD
ncbi:MAG: SDR family oxidoreductase [Candidatus Sericytochromatia bacterium]|nr:SDR family oxidoreductase [Candidatus Sericytochromatia bacterium]